MTPEQFRAITLAHALRLYARTGMKANRAYNPFAMLATASQITGQSFPSRAYLEAADALVAWAREDALAAAAQAVADEQYRERLVHACDR